MTNLPYKFVKTITILIAPIYLPLGVYIGLQLDGASYWRGYLALAVGCLLAFVDAAIYWHLMECINKKEN
jgi:hypothetical protein